MPVLDRLLTSMNLRSSDFHCMSMRRLHFLYALW